MTAYQANNPRLQTATGTSGATGDTPIIAAPGAGFQLNILSMSVQNASGVNTLVIMKETGSGTVLDNIPTGAYGSGKVTTYPPNSPKQLAYNQGLTINLSGANSTAYTVDYIVTR